LRYKQFFVHAAGFRFTRHNTDRRYERIIKLGQCELIADNRLIADIADTDGVAVIAIGTVPRCGDFSDILNIRRTAMLKAFVLWDREIDA
jgi:hypothetical protein